MYCPKCGAKVVEGGEFCPQCGYKFVNKKINSETNVSIPSTNGISTSSSIVQNTNSNNTFKLIIVGLSVVGLIAIIILFIVITINSSSNRYIKQIKKWKPYKQYDVTETVGDVFNQYITSCEWSQSKFKNGHIYYVEASGQIDGEAINARFKIDKTNRKNSKNIDKLQIDGETFENDEADIMLGAFFNAFKAGEYSVTEYIEKQYEKQKWKESYKTIVEQNKAYSNVYYSFAYVNDDDIPEFVVHYKDDYRIIAYTYADEQYSKLFDYTYGVENSNMTYRYNEKQNIIVRRYDSPQTAGTTRWSAEEHLQIDENGKMKRVGKELAKRYNTYNGSWSYYYGNNLITKDEYENSKINAEKEFTDDEKSVDEILVQLKIGI